MKPPVIQQGAALITSLVFLVMLTLMSLTVFNNAVLQGRMSGTLRDRQIAYAAAESALRDAEKYVRNSGRICGLTEHGSLNNASQSCTNGFCYNGASMSENNEKWPQKPVYAINGEKDAYNIVIDGNMKWGANQISGNAIVFANESRGAANYYRQITNCPHWAIETNSAQTNYYNEPAALPLVSAQPQYLVEGFQKSAGGETRYYYRITTRAWGTRSTTLVRLQSVFTPTN
ncbi:MAG: hypothetical protein HZB71_03605 [Betaproteobacteria bacterium]|nr:hypothetical protein [Betaproteobacteria bacterium]